MLQEALRKLQAEITAAGDDPYIAPIGSMLMDHLRTHPADAEKVLAAGKSIAGSVSAVSGEARKKAKNGVSYVSDAQAFAIVLGYFEIEQTTAAGPKALDFDIGVEDILGV